MAKLDDYLATLEPMRAAKARAALEMQVRVNGGAFMLRHQLVEDRIATGSKLVRQRSELVLQRPDGAFFDARSITKTGLDYAAFIIGPND
jgi:hypothetical protein